MAFAAAILKSNGEKTEIAWARVLGLSGDPYEGMAEFEALLIAQAQTVVERTRRILEQSKI